MKKILAFVLVAITLFTFAGCNKKTKNENKSKTEKNDKVWKIAICSDTKPFKYTKDGATTGIDVDIIAEIATAEEIKYQVNYVDFDSAVEMCKSGDADGILTASELIDTKKYPDAVFSDSYFSSQQCVAVAEDSEIKSLDELKGKKVAVKENTLSENFAKSLKEECDFKIITFKDSQKMYKALNNGKVSACVEDIATIKTSSKKNKLKILNSSSSFDYNLVLFNKDNKELKDIFNDGLKKIKENGKYDELINKHGYDNK